jgi:hypothetical protein
MLIASVAMLLHAPAYAQNITGTILGEVRTPPEW